jgi:hypothetical protein
MGKRGRYIELKNLPPSCANSVEIWDPKPLGTIRASKGIVLPIHILVQELTRHCCTIESAYACEQTASMILFHTHVPLANIFKVKQSHYRPWQALRVPVGWGSQISRQSAHEGGKVDSATYRPPLPQKIFLVFVSVRGWVDLSAIVRQEGLC